MKQKTKVYYSKDLKGVHLFINDIEEVISILEKNNLIVSFQDDMNEYDNLSEITENVGTKPYNLVITAKNDEIYESVELNYRNNYLTIKAVGSEQMHNLGIVLKDIISNSIKWHYRVFNPSIYYFSTCLILSSLFLKPFSSNFRVFIIIFTISLSLWLISYLIRKNLYGIYLIKNHQYGFLKRNKDNLIVAVISVFLGAILGVLGTLLLKK